MIKPKDNIAIMKHFNDRTARGDFSVIDELVSPNFSSRYPNIVPSNRDEFKRVEAEVFSVVKYKMVTNDYSSIGNNVKVITKNTFYVLYPYGTLQPGFLYTGESFGVWRISNGKIVEYVDQGILRGPEIVGRI